MSAHWTLTCLSSGVCAGSTLYRVCFCFDHVVPVTLNGNVFSPVPLSFSVSVSVCLSPSLSPSVITAWLYNSLFLSLTSQSSCSQLTAPKCLLVNTLLSVFSLPWFFFFLSSFTSSSPLLLPTPQRLGIDSLLCPSASSSIGWAPYPQASFHILAPEARGGGQIRIACHGPWILQASEKWALERQ